MENEIKLDTGREVFGELLGKNLENTRTIIGAAADDVLKETNFRESKWEAI